MLTLHDIRKDYGTDADTVHALRGVTLHFRPHEFVAILGPSGCGKTTLLNIIGGLDHYTEGDLVIGGVSTKEYRDRDWDTYRNHRVGFIFQSYNLIPHQSVLANVELALTLSGVSRAERRARATEALARVGLADQVKKKPGQMSGGQMQRVAIARALVNDPEIVLADEPTGALDTGTSEQIMGILSGIASRKLIVMVTHNPDLAERYATRIIRVLDGQVVSDSNPYDGVSEEVTAEAAETPTVKEVTAEAAETPTAKEETAAGTGAKTGTETGAIAAAAETAEGTETAGGARPGKAKRAGRKKTSMSFFTALSLSLNNLMTKKTRTFLTSFAGSIGIIGIALILALSNGIGLFIDKVQEDTLSSYPVEVTRETMDLSAMLSAFSGAGNDDFSPEDGYIYSNDQLTGFTNALLDGYRENDLVAFRKYIESDESHLKDHATVQYKYSVTPQTYYRLDDGSYLGVNPSEVMTKLMKYLGMSSSMTNMNAWSEMIDNRDLLESQYTVLAGQWPANYDEVVLVADKNHRISDLVLYALGFKDPEELMKMLSGNERVEADGEKWTFDELLGQTYKCIIPADYYRYDEATGTYTDLRKETGSALKNVISGGFNVKIVGIIAANPDATATSIGGAIGYTSALTRHVIELATSKNGDGTDRYPIVAAQLANPTVDVITGRPFYEADTDPASERAAKLLTWMNDPETPVRDVAAQYEQNLDDIILMQMVWENVAKVRETDKDAATLREEVGTMFDRDAMLPVRVGRQMERMGFTVGGGGTSVGKDDLINMMEGNATAQIIWAFVTALYNDAYDLRLAQAQAALATMGDDDKAAAYRAYATAAGVDVQASLWDTYRKSTMSGSTYRENCRLIGITSVDDPSAIYFYPKSFDDKDAISREIEAYNAANKNSEITYTDYIGIMLNSVSTILNVITYVLVAFVGISLVVSSIMIGIITYISVLERIKEIGILRAIGASKRDVSHVFLAETLIVGFIAGMLGILVTLVLTVPVNLIIRSLSGFDSIGARLPFLGAVVLVLISMALTLIAGLIPAQIAAKKEPVVALRSE